MNKKILIELNKLYLNLFKKSKNLDKDIEKIIKNNLWNLYT